MKRTYEVIGYRSSMKEKKEIDHLLILLRIYWEKKEVNYKKRNFFNAHAYKKEYLKIIKELKELGITIKEDKEYGKISGRRNL